MENRLNITEFQGKHSISVEEEIAADISFAKKAYELSGRFVSMVVGIAGNHKYVTLFSCQNGTEKHILAKVIKDFFKSKNVTDIVFMTEAWALKIKHPSLLNKDTLPPSQNPGKEEIFMLTYMNKDLYKSIMFPIIRSGDEVSLGAPTTAEQKGDLTVQDNIWGDYFKE